MNECVDCAAALEHCHGTVVLHEDGGTAECTEPGCRDVDPARHALVICCDQFMWECCADLAPVKYARAG